MTEIGPVPAWAIVDVETTGLNPVRDRIVEIGVVRLDEDGTVIDEWTTLVNPGDRALLSKIHGITKGDVADAPTFAEILPELLWRLSGSVVVAHNAPFDVSFLQSETVRSGVAWGPIEGLCTMALTRELGLTKSRKLALCCQEMSIDESPDHSALHDAQAVARILDRIGTRLWMLPTPDPAPAWPRPQVEVATRVRQAPIPAAAVPAGQKELAKLAIPAGLDVPAAAASTYLALLDRVVEDGEVTEGETAALQLFAHGCGISRDTARKLHVAYLDEMWRVAKLDQVVTEEERERLTLLTRLLTEALPR